MRFHFILYFIFTIALKFSIAQTDNLRFEKLNTQDGLSNNFCYCTFQDKDGFIWFGTDDGLNRWDGNDFKVFKNDPEDSTSLSNNQVFWIMGVESV